MLSLSVIIPTKNRPDDLRLAIESLLTQTLNPNELIIVDQSLTSLSQKETVKQLSGNKAFTLTYIHDQTINGLVEAKHIGMQLSKSDIICFLEDDVILSEKYLEEIEKAFRRNKSLFGAAGVITNTVEASQFKLWVRNLFFRGIFFDPRPKISHLALNDDQKLYPSPVLSGGLSCWRKQVFQKVAFNVSSGFFMFEDLEFSTRVWKEMGPCLFIVPKAKLVHSISPRNRPQGGDHFRRKLSEAVLLFRHRKGWHGAKRGLLLVIMWWGIESIVKAIMYLSLEPVSGLLSGISDGFRRRIPPQIATQSILDN